MGRWKLLELWKWRWIWDCKWKWVLIKKINKMEAPKEFKELIGTKQKLGGGLFGQKETPMQYYNILNWRWGSAKVMNMKTMKAIHPTVELLVKREGMRASRWTKGFPCRSIVFKDED
jgi:hypothetical protein